jgi:hypothetical protein
MEAGVTIIFMTRLIESASANIDAFGKTEVAGAEPLQDSVKLAVESPKLVADKFYAYYNVVRDLFNLSTEDLAIIRSVNRQLDSTRGADAFLDTFGDQKEQILAQMRQMGDLDNPDNQAGIKQLTEMMHNAWKIKQDEPDWSPKDGGPQADSVIWGFINGATDPETDIDFALCHGIERTLTEYYPDNDYTKKKDWLLCALNDVIALRGIKGQGYEAQLLPVWSASRPEGLGWVSQRRLDAYKHAHVMATG